MSDSGSKEAYNKAFKSASAHAAALRAARKVAMPSEKSRLQATPAQATAAKTADTENVSIKRKRAQVDEDVEVSDEEEDSDDSEEPFLIDDEVKKLTTQISTVDGVVMNELRPLAYATLQKVEKIELLLTEQAKIHQEEIKEQLADFYENQGQREREVVVGMGWGEKVDRKERRNRRRSKETF